MVNRKALADTTREFKRGSTADSAASKAVGAVLRQYQEEIDALTRRAKHGETAFLELYQQLYEVRDSSMTQTFRTADTHQRGGVCDLVARMDFLLMLVITLHQSMCCLHGHTPL